MLCKHTYIHMVKKNDTDEYKNPKVYVNVCIPYEDYIMAKELKLNLSEVARRGFKAELDKLKKT